MANEALAAPSGEASTPPEGDKQKEIDRKDRKGKEVKEGDGGSGDESKDESMDSDVGPRKEKGKSPKKNDEEVAEAGQKYQFFFNDYP
jgi:hypothetical protein